MTAGLLFRITVSYGNILCLILCFIRNILLYFSNLDDQELICNDCFAKLSREELEVHSW